ncbi:MAG: murein L,D-transpeptidase [Sphingomonadales bacterium]|nr:murein L,D-transpeptidase [Sphingomonadales bacterium]NCQ21336.1 murein L,D-transpeptidase [Sphingomonadales bacterium]NCT03499.1 murein L,D-transpeptidase [Sphingomonadales bacterium]
MRFNLAPFAPLCLLLGACGGDASDDSAQQDQADTAAIRNDNGADTMASNDGAASADAIPDSEARPIMQAQVVLERLGFGPGVIDGKTGASLTNAVKGFQEARGLPVTGKLDDATRKALAQGSTVAATRIVTIPDNWGDITFTAMPDGAAEQAKMDRLGYETLTEKLAERFHTTADVLAQLNPGGRPAGADGASPAPSSTANSADSAPTFRPGQQVRVPNIGADRIAAESVDNKDWLETLRSLGVGTDQPNVARILVDESEGWLKAYDDKDTLVAMFSVTTGSSNDPLPIGEWDVQGKAYNPPYSYDPKLLRNAPDSDDTQQLPPGPNGPVGVVWIDLSKEHYGIHGTPSPETIGRAQSNGCVRLTNWDAARLAQMVTGSTKVVFRK